MRCSICGIRIDSVDEAVQDGWAPYFYDGVTADKEWTLPPVKIGPSLLLSC